MTEARMEADVNFSVTSPSFFQLVLDILGKSRE